jgi:hypothetical protein
MASLKPGEHLYGSQCLTEMIVLKAPGGDVVVACGGEATSSKKASVPAVAPTPGAIPTLLGKRYADDELGIELLCVKGCAEQLSVNGVPLLVREAKPLPASD